jgi:hypothetical protein
MRKSYVTRQQARAKVQALEAFKTSNGQLFGRWETYHPVGTPSPHRYVVYSYGEHWPLFISCDGVWYGNANKRSPTTSQHHGYTHPHTNVVWLTCGEMKKLASWGLHYVRGVTTDWKSLQDANPEPSLLDAIAFAENAR